MRIKPGYKVREVAGEKMVVMQGKEGVDLTRVVLLNPSAEWLWNSLRGREFSPGNAAGLLVDKYAITESRAVSDAEAWIGSMVKVGLIEV